MLVALKNSKPDEPRKFAAMLDFETHSESEAEEEAKSELMARFSRLHVDDMTSSMEREKARGKIG